MRVTWEPGKRPENLREPDEDQNPLTKGHLDILREQHEAADHDHGIFAVEAMVFCYEARIRPPRWLVDWMGERFAAWLDLKADTLDKALGVGSAGPGCQNPLKRLQLRNERMSDALTIFMLTVLRFSVDEAAEMVQRLKEGRGDCNTPAADWLAESYRKQWRNEISTETQSTLRDLLENQEHRRTFLASFPPI